MQKKKKSPVHWKRCVTSRSIVLLQSWALNVMSPSTIRSIWIMGLVKSTAPFWRKKELAPCQGPFALQNSLVKGVIFMSSHLNVFCSKSGKYYSYTQNVFVARREELQWDRTVEKREKKWHTRGIVKWFLQFTTCRNNKGPCSATGYVIYVLCILINYAAAVLCIAFLCN